MSDAVKTPDWEQLSYDVSRVFTPAAPVSEQALFAGRIAQVQKVIGAINQTGQHAIIYGERGVGKTSLANFLSSRIVSRAGTEALAPRINCDASDTFNSIWRKVFSRINREAVTQTPGFGSTPEKTTRSIAELLPKDTTFTPDSVRGLLAKLGTGRVLLVILDEFDRLTKQSVRRAVADTIKALSDHAVAATLVVVGVADTVGDLVSEHQSVERALVQVLMPRMTVLELHEVLDKGTEKLGMTMDPAAKAAIATLSQGLPHYTHQLALHCASAAFSMQRLEIQSSFSGSGQ